MSHVNLIDPRSSRALLLCVWVLLALAFVGPSARAQTCSSWLPGPSLPDLGLNADVESMAVIGSELHVLAEVVDPSTLTSAPRVLVLRAGLWQPLPWDDAAFGNILLFTGDGGAPAVLAARTISFTPTVRTVEYAVRTFNGTAWTLVGSMQRTFSLGNGLTFLDLTVYNGDWYVAATNSANGFLFRSSGGALTQIAQTDTVSCTPVVGGCVFFSSRSFRTLQVGTDGLYVGGRFESVTPTGGSSVLAKNLARFTGTQWELLSGQPNGEVRGMMLDSTISFTNQGLVVWGSFSQVGTLAAANIARYRSFTSTWNAFGSGLNGPATAVVQLTGQSFGTVTYAVVGGFPVGQAGALGISRWTGTAWENYGGANVTVSLQNPGSFTSAVGFGGLVVGGSGLNVNADPRYGVARWNGTAWTNVATQQGTDGFSRAITIHNGDPYVGGDFSRIDSVSAAHVARHNSATGAYEPLGAGVDGQVLALASFGGELIAGGTFSNAGGNPAANVAAWNGTQWRPLGAGLDGAVRAFTVWNGSLIAVGSFDNSGATGVGSVARWTGSAWVAVDPGFNTTDLYAAATLGSTLYVGGAQGLRRFNGTAFEVPGGAAGTVSGTVYTLFPLLGSLYVGGDFATVGSPALGNKRIARWNGSAWFAVGPNAANDFLSGSVRSIFGTSDEIFVFGEFAVLAAGSPPIATHMARYDGVSWKRLDPEGTDLLALGGVLQGDRVWAVGEFTNLGSPQVESFGVGQWARAPVFAVGPTSARVCDLSGTATVTFTVTPYGTPTLRWRKGTTPLSDNLRIMGSTTATLSIAGITAADLGSYNCVATDACGQTIASADATLSACAADFNCSGVRDVADIFSFLSAWFAGAPGSDFNNSGVRDVADIFSFLSAWFAGCP